MNEKPFGRSDVGSSEIRRQTSEQDEMRGGFRGRGPKNYQRSDESILEEINHRLTENDWLDASDIEVQVNNGNVVLDGWVEDGQSSRLAEFITQDVIGALSVENRLQVKHPTDTTPGTFGSIEDLSANYSQKVYGNPADAMREETEKADAIENMIEETGE